YNNAGGRNKYPWGSDNVRTNSRRSKGDYLANFKQNRGDYGGIAGWSSDPGGLTAPVKSYPPNDWGLYDMAGNVSEWVADVYRPIVDDEANDFNYYRGNVYMKTSIGEDGKVKIVGRDEIVYDTLSNGRIVARDLPGEIAMIPVDGEDTFLRTNFNTSDNRNYRDGDKGSSRYYDMFSEEEGLEDSKRMYNAPENVIRRDSLGNIIK